MTWFDYRMRRALMFRADGWSVAQLADHFEVPEVVVKIWLNGPKKKQKPRNHCGRRTTKSQPRDWEHEQRILAHKLHVLARRAG